VTHTSRKANLFKKEARHLIAEVMKEANTVEEIRDLIASVKKETNDVVTHVMKEANTVEKVRNLIVDVNVEEARNLIVYVKKEVRNVIADVKEGADINKEVKNLVRDLIDQVRNLKKEVVLIRMKANTDDLDDSRRKLP